MKRRPGPKEDHILVEGDNFFWLDQKAYDESKSFPLKYMFRIDTIPPVTSLSVGQSLRWLKENTSALLRELGWSIVEVRVQCDRVQARTADNDNVGDPYVQVIWWIEAKHPEYHDPKERTAKLARIE